MTVMMMVVRTVPDVVSLPNRYEGEDKRGDKRRMRLKKRKTRRGLTLEERKTVRRMSLEERKTMRGSW